ncbi:MAG: SUMF1/EgtB/PvdO family nonheme iron enzyme [Hyphomicrobiaceae bacterium]|nr:SUMF1/EgtB/PvdO family nonheme iron enzyme [Hyphomicrobiaceae bacterium]
MSKRVFISYRRDDSRYQARMIHGAFCHVVDRGNVFMDVDSIPLGVNFRKILKGWVDDCDVLLALIGPGWVDATDPATGGRRLDNPSDFVRIEIGEALARDIPVVPVLLDGTRLPHPDQLPADLKDLCDRQAEFVEYRTFDADVDRLIRKLGLAKDGPSQPQAPSAPRPSTPVAPTPPDRSAEGRVKVDAAIVHGAADGWFKPGAGKSEWFQDIPGAPEMVVVPAGSFLMGSPENEPGRFGHEGPQHSVKIAKPFAIGRHAITRGQFAAFVNDTGHKTDEGSTWRAPGFQQDDSHPVVCVNWDDATAYTEWLSKKAGKTYRLLSEAEWEYAARAGTTTPFWWGATITPSQANYDGNFVYEGGGSKGEYRKATVPVGNFAANPWGLFNVHGNSWEWCEDVWHDTYNGAPSNGSAWLQGGEQGRRVVRGGCWDGSPRSLRSANRGRGNADNRAIYLGFRLGRTLTP